MPGTERGETASTEEFGLVPELVGRRRDLPGYRAFARVCVFALDFGWMP